MNTRDANNHTVLGETLFQRVSSAKVLVVGAGGIGCELLKNLVLAGFTDIHVADLDTIDVSNLNRQFLFRKQHVGQSKAKVAHEQVLRFNPTANITSYHDNIKSGHFGPQFVQDFDIVMNALDNLDARRHVNRVCLAANVPLIESGTAGFLGQVQVIRKGETECFECYPKPTPKTFPVCTIRSNPSAPIHCIVWAKMLFGRLFGKKDDSNAVTSVEDRLAFGDGKLFADTVFNKVFVQDIQDLANMADLWKSRLPPSPLNKETLQTQTKSATNVTSATIKDQIVWSPAENLQKFFDSVHKVSDRLGADPDACMDFEKDDDDCLNFVTAASNLRSLIFEIALQSRFDVKAMAGNIIPAIATTNAIVAGMIVVEAFKILSGKFDDCRTTYLMKTPSRKRLFQSVKSGQPNSKCYVCCGSWLSVRLNTKDTTLGDFITKVVKEGLGISAPMLTVQNFIYEDGDDRMDEQLLKPMIEIPIAHNTVVHVEDFDSDIRLELTVLHSDYIPGDAPFIIEGGKSVPTRTDKASVSESTEATSSIAEIQADVDAGADESDDEDLEEVFAEGDPKAVQSLPVGSVVDIDDSSSEDVDGGDENVNSKPHTSMAATARKRSLEDDSHEPNVSAEVSSKRMR